MLVGRLLAITPLLWPAQTPADPSDTVASAPLSWGRDMSKASEVATSPRLRVLFAVAAAIMLALWAWSLVPPIEHWGNPNEDGFSYVGVFYATIICLPTGLTLLVGAIDARGRYVRRARIAFFIAAGIAIVVVAFLIIQHIANSNDGKVFGVQIGLRLERGQVHVS
jgi:hypothetical protein